MENGIIEICVICGSKRGVGGGMDMRNIVVKIGGSTLGAHDTTLRDLVTLQQQGTSAVVVHGGGPIISRWLDLHQIPSQFVRGLRVTDGAGMEVVTAVLAGLVNKQLVSTLQGMGGRAVGFSGVDGGVLTGRVRDRELGLVGETAGIDPTLLDVLRQGSFMPVIATVGLNQDQPGGLLNFNADTVAGDVAARLRADLLVFLTDVAGVQGKDGTVCTSLTPEAARALIADGTASGGMIPKLEACLTARRQGTECWIVDGRGEHALLRTLSETPGGTRIW